MRELQDIIRHFEQRREEPLALATLVRANGSSYRRPGARMLITADGVTVGALSGGCLEEEVAVRAQEVIAGGEPLLLSFDTRLRYGCNGAIDIFVERVRPELLARLAAAQRNRNDSVLATVFENSQSLGTQLLSSADEALPGAFMQLIPPPLRLVLIGHGPDGIALRGLAAVLGWTVIETEEVSALPNDFDEWTAAVVKTHNYGRDYAALEKLLPLALPYVGLLGPRRRRDQLLHVLVEAGVTIRSQLFAPAGLDIGAESPEEIALAIVAEIQATFAEGAGRSLRERKTPIHLAPEFAAALIR
jgi:xanthine dehydrogenase accessory factor